MKRLFKNLIVISIVLFGCKKTEYVEKEYSWKQHSEIIYGMKYLLNSCSTLNELLLLGEDFLAKIDSNNNIKSCITTNNVHSKKFSLSEKILVGIPEGKNEAGQINFYYIPQLDQNLNAKFIQISSLDSTFLCFNEIETIKDPIFAFNNSYQLLVPYITNLNIDGTYRQSFALITINVNPNANPTYGSEDNFISISDTKIIKLPICEYTSKIVIHSIAKDFIVFNGNVVAKIYSDGTYKIINMDGFSPSNFFEAEGKLYTISNVGFCVSTDKGESWKLIPYHYFGEFSGSLFSVINNRIIMSTGSTLEEIIFTETGYNKEELKNDGLEGNLITSISEFNGKVYITTLSGLFYKEINDFFDRNEKTQTSSNSYY